MCFIYYQSVTHYFSKVLRFISTNGAILDRGNRIVPIVENNAVARYQLIFLNANNGVGQGHHLSALLFPLKPSQSKENQ